MNEHDSRVGRRTDQDALCCIDPTTPLPRVLERVRTRWVGVAKRLNGNCCCLITAATKYILFRYEGIPYSVTCESFSMDWDVYGAHFEEIVDSLRCLGCKLYFCDTRPRSVPSEKPEKKGEE